MKIEIADVEALLDKAPADSAVNALTFMRMEIATLLRCNATFHAFKPSGKWKYSGRGWLSSKVFEVYSGEDRVRQILEDNDGRWPGMSSQGGDLTLAVIPDERCSYGYPFMVVRPPWSTEGKEA